MLVGSERKRVMFWLPKVFQEFSQQGRGGRWGGNKYQNQGLRTGVIITRFQITAILQWLIWEVEKVGEILKSKRAQVFEVMNGKVIWASNKHNFKKLEILHTKTNF